MQPLTLDFAADERHSGFRLERLEVLNWGTFNHNVWRIEPNGQNALLTGDIGSGKSTLVDAVVTLLVPHQRIVYNKAAGAEGKERTLYSYIRGEYKAEKNLDTHSARAVSLRDDNSYTVLLAWFYHQGFDQGLTLAQVFWLKDNNRNPERFFVLSESPLSIAADFADFGQDIATLKKRLQGRSGISVYNQFKDYAIRFRQAFGINEEKALELFYQTVSMKAVGDLTDFVRNHMLERPDVATRIDALRRNFDNLNRAHAAVLVARDQISKLEPLVADGNRHAELERQGENLSHAREALPVWFAAHKIGLLEARIATLTDSIAAAQQRLQQNDREQQALRQQIQELQRSIDRHGGNRLAELEREMAHQAGERERLRAEAERYRQLATKLELMSVRGPDSFVRNRSSAEQALDQLRQRRRELETQRTDAAVELRGHKQMIEQIDAELASLRQRRSNIPLNTLAIRDGLTEALNLDDAELPFVGELLQVADDERDWEGAIERLLHNFGLSLLVPERLYHQVSRFVDRTRLRGRLVYFRVRNDDRRSPPSVNGHADPRQLARKLQVKPDSEFYDWLSRELNLRFDYLCCDDLAEFQRLPKAITRAGQIKSGGQRHEKDDRHALDDRSRYVLGWSNQDKIAALEAQRQGLVERAAAAAQRIASGDRELEALAERELNLTRLLDIKDYSAIDWAGPAQRFSALEQEHKQLLAGSDVLNGLRQQLEQAERSVTELGQKRDDINRQKGKHEENLEQDQQSLTDARTVADQLTPDERARWFPEVATIVGDVNAINLKNLDKTRAECRAELDKHIASVNDRRGRLGQSIVRQMADYRSDYPAETSEVDADIKALGEFAAMLEALREQDLPRHERRFKQLLNEESIRDIALFQNQLERDRQAIAEKIGQINRSLRAIEYTPGTYIELVADTSQDPEVREFQSELRGCLAHSIGADVNDGGEAELYNEQRFLAVKAIVERFNGRENFSELDRRWTRKVTDVRNWFLFSAVERYLEDDSEKEFFTGTAGKSGGQKEKLAYTILASALAYQFGLEWDSRRSRSFRFVVIDEAFGRGSDESTRYALELFNKLQLQLLIVTPLQKVHVIEDYIAAVHFVHNEDGMNSQVRNLTIEQYREHKARYRDSA